MTLFLMISIGLVAWFGGIYHNFHTIKVAELAAFKTLDRLMFALQAIDPEAANMLANEMLSYARGGIDLLELIDQSDKIKRKYREHLT